MFYKNNLDRQCFVVCYYTHKHKSVICCPWRTNIVNMSLIVCKFFFYDDENAVCYLQTSNLRLFHQNLAFYQ